MNTDDVVSMAVKSGIEIRTGEWGFICDKTIKILFEFAKLVEADAISKERLACARLCDKQAKGNDKDNLWIGCAAHLAHKIRTRKKP